jgi:hypothetical protein
LQFAPSDYWAPLCLSPSGFPTVESAHGSPWLTAWVTIFVVHSPPVYKLASRWRPWGLSFRCCWLREFPWFTDCFFWDSLLRFWIWRSLRLRASVSVWCPSVDCLLYFCLRCVWELLFIVPSSSIVALLGVLWVGIRLHYSVSWVL